jgi:hypothetical protein
MGKRELLLIAAFVVLGVVVYQVSAPPPAPGERGFSIRRIFDNVRRELQSNRSSAVVTTTTTHPADAQLTELRLRPGGGDLTITGEARDTIEAELQVRSSGPDDAEAEKLARRTQLKLDRAGGSLNAEVSYPVEGRQRLERMVLRIPSRLRVRIEPFGGALTITDVAEAEIAGARGDMQVSRISGRLVTSNTGGRATIADVGTVKLTTRGTDVQLERVKGEAALNVRSGDLKIVDVKGPIDLDSNGTDIVIERLDHTTGTLRVNAVNGKLSVRGLRTDGRIDSRNAEVDGAAGDLRGRRTRAAHAAFGRLSARRDGDRRPHHAAGWRTERDHQRTAAARERSRARRRRHDHDPHDARRHHGSKPRRRKIGTLIRRCRRFSAFSERQL